MASPHVAGVAALYLGSNPGKTPAEVKAWFISEASTGLVRLDCDGAVSKASCELSPNIFTYSPCA